MGQQPTNIYFLTQDQKEDGQKHSNILPNLHADNLQKTTTFFKYYKSKSIFF